ncbi:MAG: hypothetical protein PUA68_07250 [Bacilli bacterium]|nr:hypothetical protein [Bacilli bacterium]
MKKFKYLTFLFITFLCFTNVFAADCNKYACATCNYKLLSGDTVTFTVGSSGSKPVSVSISNNHKDSNYNKLVTNHEIPASRFVSDSKNTIACPKQLNFTVGTSHAGVTTYNFFIDSNSTSKAVVKLSNEDNNNKTIDGKSPEESNSSKDTISCTYDSKLTTSRNPNEKGPDVTIVSDGKNKIDYTFSKTGWKISDKVDGAVKASDFSEAIKTRKCPTLYARCGSSGNDAFCSVSTKNNDQFRDEPSIAEEDKDADQTEKERQEAANAFIAVKPGIKINIKIQGQGCGVFSQELIEWLQWVLDVVRVGGLILAVVLGITDYVKATFASKEDSMNQANRNFATRLLCLGILFLIPTLIEFLLTLLNIGVTAIDPTCGLK